METEEEDAVCTPKNEPTTSVKAAKRTNNKMDPELANRSPVSSLKTAITPKRAKFYDQEQKCTECEFITNKRLLFKKHCILNHADKFDQEFLLNHYKCDFCDKVFKDPIQLSNHKNARIFLQHEVN